MTDFLLSSDEALAAYKGDGDEIYITQGLLRVAQAQHDRTFPLAKQEGLEIGIQQGKAKGRREVVEWMNKHRTESTREFICFTILIINWQSQLEKWGIK